MQNLFPAQKSLEKMFCDLCTNHVKVLELKGDCFKLHVPSIHFALHRNLVGWDFYKFYCTLIFGIYPSFNQASVISDPAKKNE